MKKLKKDDTITILGRRWFEKVNGNTYHSVVVYINGQEIGREDFAYGYGNQYNQTAYELLEKKYDLGLKTYSSGIKEPLWKLKDRGINIIDSVTDVARKKDL